MIWPQGSSYALAKNSITHKRIIFIKQVKSISDFVYLNDMCAGSEVVIIHFSGYAWRCHFPETNFS